MRRLLIRLVALETALVGWLSYWLFLLYANNPLASQGLAVQLGRFPQLSFTTVDISVLAIIAALSIFLAFKFQRGLRPGIRLERALQMLENLMKRNLVLEAQVAEMKLEKARVGMAPSAVQASEPSLGSWERAFRTPIEAGPATPPTPRVSSGSEEKSFQRGTSFARPPKPDMRPASLANIPAMFKSSQSADRSLDKPSPPEERSSIKPDDKLPMSGGSSEHGLWEDSPKRVSETSRILTPSPVPRSPAGVIPVSSRQPYIPVPVPKAPPPSVIVGPGPSHSPQLRPIAKPVVPSQVAPRPSSSPPRSPAASPGKPPSHLVPVRLAEAKAAAPVTAPEASPLASETKESLVKPDTGPQPTDSKAESAVGSKESEPPSTTSEEGDEKPDAKSTSKPLKKFSYEEED